MQPRVSILGVPVDAVTRSEAVSRIGDMLRSNTQHHVATPNPEMLVEASKNKQLFAVLQQTALNVPDGTGLLWAARRVGTPLPQRVTGVDVMTDVCCANNGPVFLLGAIPGIAEHAADALKKKNPALVIAGTFAGFPAVGGVVLAANVTGFDAPPGPSIVKVFGSNSKIFRSLLFI
jgi:N-acetylglucosaminyldiphosphoundecaprenol N-acetyl-beta-D-mannosaminyltransferase